MAAERNYDVGNRELLAVKVAALAGGGTTPVLGLDRPQELAVHKAKRLNSHQARWTLFFF